MERRKYPRIDTGDFLFVTKLPEERNGSDGGGSKYLCTKDVSRNGFRIQADRHIEPSTLVKVLVPKGASSADALTILGIVRWADTKMTDERKFNVGVEFFDLDNADGNEWIEKYEANAFHALEKLQKYFAKV